MVWYGMVWYGMILHGMVWYVMLAGDNAGRSLTFSMFTVVSLFTVNVSPKIFRWATFFLSSVPPNQEVGGVRVQWYIKRHIYVWHSLLWCLLMVEMNWNGLSFIATRDIHECLGGKERNPGCRLQSVTIRWKRNKSNIDNIRGKGNKIRTISSLTIWIVVPQQVGQKRERKLLVTQEMLLFWLLACHIHFLVGAWQNAENNGIDFFEDLFRYFVIFLL